MQNKALVSSASSSLPIEPEVRARQVKRFASRVTWGMIVTCNVVLLSGVWASGVNLDRLIRIPDVFNPKADVCVRQSWQKVVESQEAIQLCTEWINLSDTSGQTHSFRQETQIKQGADGRLYFDHGPQVDYRLFVLIAYVLSITVGGIVVTRYLVNRYRQKLEQAAAQHTAPTR